MSGGAPAGGDKTVWLGLAYPDYTPAVGEEDVYFSKLGGEAKLLHALPGDVRCKGCQKMSTFVGQLHAPLGSFTRVLYLYTCTEEKCQNTPGAWTVLRGQVHHPEWNAASGEKDTAAPAAAKPAVTSFEVDDDWGDDDDAGGFGGGGDDDGFGGGGGFGDEPAAAAPAAPAPVAARASTPAAAAATIIAEKVYTHVAPNATSSSSSEEDTINRPPRVFKMASLDTEMEPDEKDTFVGKEKEKYRAQYASVQVSENKPDADLKAEAPEDYEKHGSNRQRAFLKYAKRIRRSPYQAIRWGFNVKPLSINGTAHPARQACPNCGAARVPEAQLVSSALTYLPGLEFGTVTIYTCAAMCHAGEHYLEEDAVVDAEPEF